MSLYGALAALVDLVHAFSMLVWGLGLPLLVWHHFPRLSRTVDQSSAALLLIHGTADTQVPLSHSQALFGAAKGNARLLTVAGAEHSAMPSDPTGVVRRETLAWFDGWLGPTDQTSCRSVPR